jgi:hypothetical protein
MQNRGQCISDWPDDFYLDLRVARLASALHQLLFQQTVLGLSIACAP